MYMHTTAGIEYFDLTPIIRRTLQLARERVRRFKIEMTEHLLIIISRLYNKYPSLSLQTLLFILVSIFYWMIS